MNRLTKEQAAILGLYTGIACGPFSDIQELAEEVAGCSIWTHQFANEEIVEKLKELVKPRFLAICHQPEESE